MIKRLLLAAAVILNIAACNNKKHAQDEAIIKTENMTINQDSALYLFIGTYTQTDSKGIYIYMLDTINGNSKYISEVEVGNPSYLTLSKDERFVYSVSENDNETSPVSAYSFNKENGNLTFINSIPAGGAAPCYINTDETNSHLVTANYSSGSITAINIAADGSLVGGSQQIVTFLGKGTDTERQSQPHLHCVQFSPDYKYLFANDLGTDKIHKMDLNKTNDEGKFLSLATPPFFSAGAGSGPRHLEFHPNGKYAYLITELSGEVLVYDYENGGLHEKQRIVADSLQAKGSADIHITPNGKFLYASNRLQGDGIAIFSIGQDGTLTKIGYQETGIHPRNFAITPNGKLLLVACRDSNVIQVFSIDQNTGQLENLYKDIAIDMPACLKFTSCK